MDLGLKDKKVFIAGSSRGLGYAVAKTIAQEGGIVTLIGRKEQGLKEAQEELIKLGNTQIHYLTGDASDPETGVRLINEAADQMGGIDLLVTNTGGPPSGKFEEHLEEVWQKAIEMVFLSHVRLIRSALPYLRKSSSPSVLTITSYSVKQPIPNLILSNSIRGATIGLTKSLAAELGPEGIRFNSILPGWTKTERVLEIMSFRAEQNNTSVEEEITKITADIPLGRMATADEIGQAAAFLLSPAASYITGQMLVVGGGIYKGTM
jgi:3-oxoacyl-[acyl-carrier protein] reductase